MQPEARGQEEVEGAVHRISLPGVQSRVERVESKYTKNNFGHSLGLAADTHLHGQKHF